MAMYEMLVKDLRELQEFDHLRLGHICGQAADAIEELQAYADLYKELTEKGQTVARKLIDAYPKWISVEERLPEAVPGNYSLDVLVTDGGSIAICQYFNGDGLASMWGYSGIGKITHWMPLPSTEGLNET